MNIHKQTLTNYKQLKQQDYEKKCYKGNYP